MLPCILDNHLVQIQWVDSRKTIFPSEMENKRNESELLASLKKNPYALSITS